MIGTILIGHYVVEDGGGYRLVYGDVGWVGGVGRRWGWSWGMGWGLGCELLWWWDRRGVGGVGCGMLGEGGVGIWGWLCVAERSNGGRGAGGGLGGMAGRREVWEEGMGGGLECMGTEVVRFVDISFVLGGGCCVASSMEVMHDGDDGIRMKGEGDEWHGSDDFGGGIDAMMVAGWGEAVDAQQDTTESRRKMFFRWLKSLAVPEFDKESIVMEFESAQSNTTAKLPILKLGEYEMWVIRIKQYFQVQDYALWEVIENGNSWVSVPQTAQENGTSVTKMSVPVTAEEKTNKKNDVKARSLLLMALPNEHQLTFSQYSDAKTMFAAIETRFGGNEATKKTQKTLLKQQYENFSASSTESLDSIFNRLQKIVSRLAILGVVITQEDLNSKFLRSLPPEWNTHVVVWMNKADIETMSIDDLYNNFKIVEQDVKKSVGASSGAQNLAFMTAPSTSSTNDVNTANPAYEVSTVIPNINTGCPQVSTANFSDNTMYAFMVENPNGSNILQQDLEQIHKDDLEAIDLKWQLSLLSMRAKRYFQRTGKKIFIYANDTVGYDKSKVECFNCHKIGYFARECRVPKNKEGQFRYQDNTRKQGNNEDTSSKEMLAIDGVGFNWSDMAKEQVQTNMALMAFSDSEVYNDKTCTKTCLKNYETLKKQCDDLIVKHNQTEFTAATYKRVLKREVACKDYEINVLKSEFKKVKQEKEGIEFKIEKFDNASKSLNKLLESQITDKSKKGLGYNVVPPPYPLIYNRPKKLDLSYSGLDEFKDPKFKSYGSKDSKLESNIVCDTKSYDSKENSDDSLVKEQVSEDTSSFVESPLNVDKETVFLVDKKLPNENQTLLKIPRKDNMYSFDMKNIVPKESLTCLVAKATSDNNLWHRRLSHIKEKGIKREYSIARTPQQNSVAERRNMTLIEAARTMLADFKLPTTFHGVKIVLLLDISPKEVNAVLDNHVNYSQSRTLKTCSLWELVIHLKPLMLSSSVMKITKIDLGNINNSYTVPTTPNTRIHKDHPIENVIGDVKSSVQTRRMTKPTSKQGFLSAVWILADLPIGKRAIGTKWIFKNKKDERGIMISYKARLVTQGDKKKCKKQTVVATSTTEAEYVAAASCCGQVLWIQNQLLDYGYNFMNTVINIDNNGDMGDRMEKAATTASSLEAEQDSGSGPRCQDTILGDVDAQTRFETTSKQSNDPPLSRGYTLRSGEDSLKLLELMDLCTTICYALTVNPTIYTSCIQQFWATIKAKTVNGKRQIQALIDKKKVIITETSIKSNLHLEDAGGGHRKDIPQLPQEETQQDDSVPTPSNDPPLSEIADLKKRVQRLERKKKSRTTGLKRLKKVGRGAIEDIDKDADVSLVDDTQGRSDDAKMFDINDLHGDEVNVDMLVGDNQE
ncbi:putative ribonuclease H-like domain-containing protein [Tanacetum coccineum]